MSWVTRYPAPFSSVCPSLPSVTHVLAETHLAFDIPSQTQPWVWAKYFLTIHAHAVFLYSFQIASTLSTFPFCVCVLSRSPCSSVWASWHFLLISSSLRWTLLQLRGCDPGVSTFFGPSSLQLLIPRDSSNHIPAAANFWFSEVELYDVDLCPDLSGS